MSKTPSQSRRVKREYIRKLNKQIAKLKGAYANGVKAVGQDNTRDAGKDT